MKGLRKASPHALLTWVIPIKARDKAEVEYTYKVYVREWRRPARPATGERGRRDRGDKPRLGRPDLDGELAVNDLGGRALVFGGRVALSAIGGWHSRLRAGPGEVGITGTPWGGPPLKTVPAATPRGNVCPAGRGAL